MTSRHRSLTSHLANSASLSNIVAQSADALMIVDAAGSVRFANPAAEQLFGRPLTRLIGSPFGYPITETNSAPIEIVRPDSSVVIVEMRVSPISWQNDVAHLIALRDISEQASHERRLIETQRFLRSTLDAIDAQIAIIDQNGTILAVNAAWQAVARSADADPYMSGVGHNYFKACESAAGHPTDEPIAIAAMARIRAMLEGRQTDFRYEYSCPVNGKLTWYSMRVTRFFEGEQPRLVIAYEDITARKQTERLDRQRREVLEMVARNRPLGEVIDRLLLMIAEQYPTLVYAAFSFHNRNRSLHSWMQSNADPIAVTTFDHWAASNNTYPSLQGQPLPILVVPTVRLDPLVGDAAHQLGIETCWCASFGIGGLLISQRMHTTPNEEDRRFIELLTQLTSIAYEQHERTRQLDYQAHHDALTGLPNRVLFEDRLMQAIETARRTKHMVAVLFIDLDRFKQVNDTLGHAVGDKLLVQLARRLEGTVRAVDTLARRGGDEFMLVLNDVSESAQVSIVANRLLDVLRMPFMVEGQELFIGASIGASIFPIDAENSDMIQRNADTAMYRAKRTIGNSFQFFDSEMNSAAVERMHLENGLRRALERKELRIHYQPKVNAEGLLIGAEALLRWEHPEEGLLPPGRFIGLAEELGLIVPIGEWVLYEVCRQMVRWREAGLPELRLAVNVSPVQLAQNSFLDSLARILREFAVGPRALELELTESMLMGDFVLVARQLAELRSLHLNLAIDDFGTGYSSLSYLRNLPIDILKIDRSFIEGIDDDHARSARAIVHTIVTLAHQLGAQVVAEGVTRSSQMDFLHSIGCDQYQGFLFSEPLPVQDFEALLYSSYRQGQIRLHVR